MFQEMMISAGGGGSFPSSDNIKYAFEGTSLMYRNTTVPVANAPTIPSQNLGDKMLLCLKANTAFTVWLSATINYPSTNGYVFIWRDVITTGTDLRFSLYIESTVDQNYDIVYMVYSGS